MGSNSRMHMEYNTRHVRGKGVIELIWKKCEGLYHNALTLDERTPGASIVMLCWYCPSNG